MKVPMRMPVSMVAPLKLRCTTEADSCTPPLLSTSTGTPNTSAAVCTAALVACAWIWGLACEWRGETKRIETRRRTHRVGREVGQGDGPLMAPRQRAPVRGGVARVVFGLEEVGVDVLEAPALQARQLPVLVVPPRPH